MRPEVLPSRQVLAGVRAHVGQLEYLIAVHTISQNQFDLQVEILSPTVWNSLVNNRRLFDLFTEFSTPLNTFARAPTLSTSISNALHAMNLTISGPQFGWKSFGASGARDFLYLNAPTRSQGTTRLVSTPISAFLLTYLDNSLASSYLIDASPRGARFSSPILSDQYTRLLVGTNATAAYPATPEVVVAMRRPGIDNLTHSETKQALSGIADFSVENPQVKFFVRMHPRDSDAREVRTLLQRAGANVTFLPEHLRVLCARASALLSFGGTAPADALCVGRPSIEIRTSGTPIRGNAANLSRFGLSHPISSDEVSQGLNFALSDPARLAEKQLQQLERQLPGFRQSTLAFTSLMDLLTTYR